MLASKPLRQTCGGQNAITCRVLDAGWNPGRFDTRSRAIARLRIVQADNGSACANNKLRNDPVIARGGRVCEFVTIMSTDVIEMSDITASLGYGKTVLGEPNGRMGYDLGNDPTLQADLASRYYRRLLDELGVYLNATGRLLAREAQASSLAKAVALSGRPSPGTAHVHARFSDLNGKVVSLSELSAILDFAAEVCSYSALAGNHVAVTTYDIDNPWHRRYRTFLLKEASDIVSYYPSPDLAPVVGSLDADTLERTQSTVESILDTLSAVDPAAFGDIREFVSEIVVFKGRRVRGASAPSYFGCVFIREPELESESGKWLWLAEHIVHEAAHHHLFVVMSNEQLVDNDPLVTSPVRNDPRPLSGVIHAMFVEARLVRMFRILQVTAIPIPRALVDAKLDEAIRLHRDCVEIVSQHAEALTSTGRDLTAYMASI